MEKNVTEKKSVLLEYWLLYSSIKYPVMSSFFRLPWYVFIYQKFSKNTFEIWSKSLKFSAKPIMLIMHNLISNIYCGIQLLARILKYQFLGALFDPIYRVW
jgi:hypothetical protein